MNVPKLFIFSAYRTDRTEAQNVECHAVARMQLLKAGCAFKEVIGVYKGKQEQSILVLEDSRGFVEPLVRELCERYNQDCYLRRETSGQCVLIDQKARVTHLDGCLINTPRSLALKCDSYTYDPVEDQYYTVA